MTILRKLLGLAGAAGRLFGLKAGPDVEPLPKLRDHWVPSGNSTQAWSVGPGRCYWCLAYQTTPEFEKPCPRKRPNTVEIA